VISGWLLAAAVVVPLPLPTYATVPVVPSPALVERNPFAAGGGLIAASAPDASGDGRAWIVAWQNAAPFRLPPAPGPQAPGTPAFMQLGAIAPSGELYAERGKPYFGVSMGVDYSIYRLRSGAWIPVDTNGCADSSNGIAHLFGVEADGTLDVTFESPDAVNFDAANAGEEAPSAARILHGACTTLGSFDLRAVSGSYAAGFRGYYANGKIAATNLNREAQHVVAIRWHAGRLVELGPGVALALADDGTAVGRGAAHAALWDVAGTAIDLTPHAKASTAYAIDATHRVIGSLTASDGRHYAFVWQNGRLQHLDDLAAAPGWRFEAAFAFAADGGIAGIGTHNGVATGFVLR
jgi:hypothetical protein